MARRPFDVPVATNRPPNVAPTTRIVNLATLPANKIVAFTDGAGMRLEQGQRSFGGWGYSLFYGAHRRLAFGGNPSCTSNQMELTAILRALEAIQRPTADIVVVADSQYSIGCVSAWYRGWQRNGWRTANGRPVENRDLIEAILVEKARLGNRVTFEWTPGHSGNILNDVADALATRGKEITRLGGQGLVYEGDEATVALTDIMVAVETDRRRREERALRPSGRVRNRTEDRAAQAVARAAERRAREEEASRVRLAREARENAERVAREAKEASEARIKRNFDI